MRYLIVNADTTPFNLNEVGATDGFDAVLRSVEPSVGAWAYSNVDGTLEVSTFAEAAQTLARFGQVTRIAD